MEIGIYETIVTDENISQICRKIAGAGEETDVFQICERYGTKPDEFRAYDTYKIYDSGETKIIKKVELREYNNYLRYLKGKDLNVPKLLGSDTEGKDFWIMLENVEGQDLRDMTDELACAAADSISTIQNQYWGSEDADRFEEYLERIHRRYECIKDNPQIAPASLPPIPSFLYLSHSECSISFVFTTTLYKPSTSIQKSSTGALSRLQSHMI